MSETCSVCGQLLNDVGVCEHCPHESFTVYRIDEDNDIDVLYSPFNEYVVVKQRFLLHGKLMKTEYTVEPIRENNIVFLGGTWDVEYNDKEQEFIFYGTRHECQQFMKKTTGHIDTRHNYKKMQGNNEDDA